MSNYFNSPGYEFRNGLCISMTLGTGLTPEPQCLRLRDGNTFSMDVLCGLNKRGLKGLTRSRCVADVTPGSQPNLDVVELYLILPFQWVLPTPLPLCSQNRELLSAKVIPTVLGEIPRDHYLPKPDPLSCWRKRLACMKRTGSPGREGPWQPACSPKQWTPGTGADSEPGLCQCFPGWHTFLL